MQWNKNLLILESISRELVGEQHTTLTGRQSVWALKHQLWALTPAPVLSAAQAPLADQLPRMRPGKHNWVAAHRFTESFLLAFSKWVAISKFYRKPEFEKKTKKTYQLYWVSLHVYIMPQRFLDLSSKPSNPDMLWSKETCFIFLWTLIYKKNSISTVCLYVGETRKWVWFCMSSY